MKSLFAQASSEAGAAESPDRRKFFQHAGMLGLGAAAAGLTLSSTPARAFTSSRAQASGQTADSITEIFTAFLIAEDLATTFYYNGLVGGVIQDVNLAGPGGTATSVSASGNVGNVDYLRAALTEEIDHANLFRKAIGGSDVSAVQDPYQTFYFPARTFDALSNFLTVLNALEDAFIGAYLTVVGELATKAARAATGIYDFEDDSKYTASQYEIMAKVAAAILGVESEHRVLGRVIGNNNPANDLAYQQTDGLQTIYNGSASAVVALTPFLTPSTGPGFSFKTARSLAKNVAMPVQGLTYPVW